MPWPQERTERGHFVSHVLEQNRQAQLADELGAPEQFRNAISQAATAGPHLDFDTVKPQGSETKREWGSLSAQIQRGP